MAGCALYVGDKHGRDEGRSESGSGSETRAHKEISGIPLRGWESVLNTCFPYRIHFEPQSAVALMPAWRSSLLHTRPLPRRSSRGRDGGGKKGHWFISFLNNSLLFSSSLSIVATFWSIALDVSATIHFYLRSDAAGRWDSSPFPPSSSSSSRHSLVPLLTRPAVCDFISLRRNHRRRLSLTAGVDSQAPDKKTPRQSHPTSLTLKGRIQKFTRDNGGIVVDFAIKILSHSVDFMSRRYNVNLFWWYTKNVCALKIKAIKGKIFSAKR